MINLWFDKLGQRQDVKYQVTKSNLLKVAFLKLIETFLLFLASRKFIGSEFRLLNYKWIPHQDFESQEILMESRLGVCLYKSMRAIALEESVIQTWVQLKHGKEITYYWVRIANNGRLLDSTFSLFDKQIVLNEILARGLKPLENSSNINEENRIRFCKVFFLFLKVRFSSKCKIVFQGLFAHQEIWSASVVGEDDFPRDKVKWFEFPKIGETVADPFLYVHNQELYIFVEVLSNGKGEIHVGRLVNDQIQYLGLALENEYHLSFPFIFEYGTEILMIPESCESERISAYSSKKFPGNWEESYVLLDNVLAVDSFVINHNNMWYLFTNLSSGVIENFSAELWIFISEDPILQDWRLHSSSPITMDGMKARNGGFFKKDGELFRVSQIPKFSKYGFGISLNRITELTPTTYQEEKFVEYLGGFFKGQTGNHHLSYSDGYYGVDYSAMVNRGK